MAAVSLGDWRAELSHVQLGALCGTYKFLFNVSCSFQSCGSPGMSQYRNFEDENKSESIPMRVCVKVSRSSADRHQKGHVLTV